MKTIGIIGGVGPQTTSEVYLSIIDLIKKSGEEKYPPIVIYNLPFPFIIEDEAIVQGINSEKMIPYLIEGAKILEKSGADFGILPCNTLHKYIEEIRQSVKIPFLSILDETVIVLKNMDFKSVGILATETTIRTKIYDKALKQNSINVICPSRHEQDTINEIIIDLLKGKKTAAQIESLKLVCESLQKKGAKAILLACTDLQLIASEISVSIPIIDTTEILIKSSVKEILKTA